MVCCDTNFLIGLIRKTPQAISKLKQLGDVSLTTTIINVAELHKGAYRMNNVTKEIEGIRSLLEDFSILNLDKSGCNIFGRLSALLRSNQLADADLLIASIALSNNESLLTSDKVFERVPDLGVDNWK